VSGASTGPGSPGGRALADAPRLDSLDGLRGAAAVVVVAFHVWSLLDLPAAAADLWLTSPLGALVNGPGAVHVFFVLSGFVLAISLGRDAGRGRVPRFYVRRWFRIQPPYMAAVLLGWAITFDLPRYGTAAARAVAPACRQLPARVMPEVLALPGMAYGLLPVGWSLSVEFAISMLFPLLLAVALRAHWGALLALCAGLLFVRDPRIRFLVFAFDFALGIALFLERERCARALAHLPRWGAPLLVLAALVLIQAPYGLQLQTTGRAGLAEGHTAPVVVLMGLGSALLVAAALHVGSVRAALETPLARFYGRISYSLYLVHHTVIFALQCRLMGVELIRPIGGALLFPVVLALSTGLATLGWYGVEQPSIRAGRALIRRGEALLGRRGRPAAPAAD
jgi:peptidoglycan/LPS O-acetylase OafA/YrhL